MNVFYNIQKPTFHIESYTKVPVSFMARLNSMDDYGNIKEPYDIKLKKTSFFGMIKRTITKRVFLPSGFNAEKEFKKGREITGKILL